MNVKMNEITVSKKLDGANSIERFYANTGILITGATGFVGKGILEKLMRVSKHHHHFHPYSTEEKPNNRTTI